MFSNLFKPTDLWSAAKKGDIATIEKLVASGHDVNAKKAGFVREGYTPLHIAVVSGQKDAVKALVRLGADVNVKNNEQQTPLAIAVTELETPDIAEMLIDLGAKINNKLGGLAMTPLDLAASNNKVKMVEMLLRRGASPNVGKGEKRSDPIQACDHDGNVEILRLLLKAGADVNLVHCGSRAICSAAVFGHGEFVKLLLEAGADPSQPEESGCTPLMAAVAGGNIDIVKMMVAAGAKPDAVRFSGKPETALDFAERDRKQENIAIAEYLKSVGAKRAAELPASETTPPKDEDDDETFWQLPDDSTLTASLEPWPAKAGPAKLRIEITPNGHDSSLSFAGEICFRLSVSKDGLEPWTQIKRGRKDDENNTVFAAQIELLPTTAFIQFKVHPQWQSEPTILSDWDIKLR